MVGLGMLIDLIVKYNWKKNTEFRLPDIPNGQKVTYPLSGVGRCTRWCMRIYS